MAYKPKHRGDSQQIGGNGGGGTHKGDSWRPGEGVDCARDGHSWINPNADKKVCTACGYTKWT